MISLLRRFWTDEQFFLRMVVTATPILPLFLAQPVGRPWWERLGYAALGTLPTGAATVMGSKPTKGD